MLENLIWNRFHKNAEELFQMAFANVQSEHVADVTNNLALAIAIFLTAIHHAQFPVQNANDLVAVVV
jgi:hypothetical protein